MFVSQYLSQREAPSADNSSERSGRRGCRMPCFSLPLRSTGRTPQTSSWGRAYRYGRAAHFDVNPEEEATSSPGSLWLNRGPPFSRRYCSPSDSKFGLKPGVTLISMRQELELHCGGAGSAHVAQLMRAAPLEEGQSDSDLLSCSDMGSVLVEGNSIPPKTKEARRVKVMTELAAMGQGQTQEWLPEENDGNDLHPVGSTYSHHVSAEKTKDKSIESVEKTKDKSIDISKGYTKTMGNDLVDPTVTAGDAGKAKEGTAKGKRKKTRFRGHQNELHVECSERIEIASKQEMVLKNKPSSIKLSSCHHFQQGADFVISHGSQCTKCGQKHTGDDACPQTAPRRRHRRRKDLLAANGSRQRRNPVKGLDDLPPIVNRNSEALDRHRYHDVPSFDGSSEAHGLHAGRDGHARSQGHSRRRQRSRSHSKEQYSDNLNAEQPRIQPDHSRLRCRDFGTPRLQRRRHPSQNFHNAALHVLEEVLGPHLASDMLQQILKDMFIDPELLAELDEEQKQVLFCKMREEQLRLWKEREKKLEEEEKRIRKSKKKQNGRRIQFKLGSDGEPWTWVMGDFPGDKTVEQLIEEDAKKTASEQAEKEALELRHQSKKLGLSMEEGLKRLSLTGSGPTGAATLAMASDKETVSEKTVERDKLDPDGNETEKKSAHDLLLPDAQNGGMVYDATTAMKQNEDIHQPLDNEDQLLTASYLMPGNESDKGNNEPPIQENAAQSMHNELNANVCASDTPQSTHRGSEVSSPDLNENVSVLDQKSYHTDTITEKVPSLNIKRSSLHVVVGSPDSSLVSKDNDTSAKSDSSTPLSDKQSENTGNRKTKRSESLPVSAISPPTFTPRKTSVPMSDMKTPRTDENEARQKEEDVLQRRLLEEQEKFDEEDRLQENRLKKQEEEEEAARKESEIRALVMKKEEQRNQIKKKHEMRRRTSIDMVEQIKRRRSVEIFTSMRESRQIMAKLAEEQGPIIEKDWQQQEQKSRRAEEEMREVARRARLELAKSQNSNIKTTNEILAALSVTSDTEIKERIKPPVPTRPSSLHRCGSTNRPTSRDAIVKWYRMKEFPRGSGLDPVTGNISPWFHGIISRQAAEDLLEDKDVGTYLVRVSERIWGYTISYQAETRCKHFLIDTSHDTFQFFGDKQIQHPSLADLVNFHKKRPISTAGHEVLVIACPQQSTVPDYEELFDGLCVMQV